MLIGLHGKKQAGKDTVYERMLRLLGGQGCKVERTAFADKLYESAAAVLGVEPELLRRWKSHPEARVVLTLPGDAEMHYHVEAQQTVREYVQRYGTEGHRDLFGSDFWVERVDLSHEGRVLVATDVRFPNEAQAVLNAGGAVVHVIGPDEVEGAGDGHATEEKLPHRYIDLELLNDVRDDAFKTLDAEVLGMFLRLRREGY